MDFSHQFLDTPISKSLKFKRELTIFGGSPERPRKWIHPKSLQDNDSDADASPSKVATSVVTAGTAKVKRKEGLMDLPASQAGAVGCCLPV